MAADFDAAFLWEIGRRLLRWIFDDGARRGLPAANPLLRVSTEDGKVIFEESTPLSGRVDAGH